MSNPRAPKWDWSSHLPKMVELYNTQMSIPDIYKAIQCDGFEPCQRSVYAKFKSMGYPTDPVGRSRLLDARLPQNPTPIPVPSNIQSPTPSFYTNQQSESSLCPLPEDHMLADSTELWGNGFGYDSPHLAPNLNYADVTSDPQSRGGHMRSESHGAMSNSSAGMQTLKSGPSSEVPSSVWSPCSDGASSQNFAVATSTFDEAFDFETSAMEINGAEYFGIDTSYHSHVALPGNVHEDGLLGTKSSGMGWENGVTSGSEFFPMSSSNMEIDNDTFSFQEELPPQQLPRRSGSIASIDLKTPFQNFINTSSTAGTRNKLRSLFRAKSGSSSRSAKKYATSQYTNNTQDSGYASGFASCLTLEDIRQINSQSLREFNGLYRVACHNLHEPQGKAQCKDIATCTYCRYSSIHNLGWSARYLKLEVFLSELKLDGVYNFGALDAAGNTALHYAAAGGAGFRHLKALIDVGVDPYAANTSGELFIYCLRPIQPFTLEPNSDCLSSDDLISLLKLLEPERVFDWRDNDGQTILHALSSKITEPELRVKILQWVTYYDFVRTSHDPEANHNSRMFKDAGYPPTVRDRFGRTAQDVTLLTYDCHGQVIDAAPVNNLQKTIETNEGTQDGMTCEDLITADWRNQQVKQIKAQNILHQARPDPAYKDPETDDNVLHALSRLKSSNDTLLNLEYFNSKDTKLNHKREGNHILLNLEYFIPKCVDLNLLNREGNYPLKSFICDRPWEENETGATMSKYLDAMLWKDAKARIRSTVNVNMRDREGATALHCAAIMGRPDSVRSLIEAGGNINARSDDGISVLQATCNALEGAGKRNDGVLVHLLKEVIAYLEHAGAVLDPKSIQERGIGGR